MPPRSNRGQALLEFALVLPFMILFLAAIFDLGRGLYTYSIVASAAREGARVGITDPTNVSGIKGRAVASAGAITIDPNRVAVVCTPTCEVNNTITVTVPHTFQPVTVFFWPLTVTGKSTMTIEFVRR